MDLSLAAAPLGGVGSIFRKARAQAANSNLIINPVTSVATITSPAGAPSTTGYTNLLPASTGYAASFTGTASSGSNIVTSVSSVSGLAVGQQVLENSASAGVYPANVPLGAVINAIDAGVSTITNSKNSTGGASITLKAWNNANLRLIGGVPGSYSGNFLTVGATVGNSVTPPTAQNTGWSPQRVEFITDGANITTAAPAVMVRTFRNGVSPNSFRVAIDGAYQSSDPVAFGASSWTLIQFQSAGSHTVQFELPPGIVITALWVITGSTVTPTSYPVGYEALSFGDSFYLSGASGSWPGRGIAQQFGLQMGALMDHSAVGATGYTADGGSNYAWTNALRTRDVLIKNYKMICFFGSVNDGGASAATLQAAALATWQAVRANNPTAFIVVFGVPTTVNLSAGTATTMEGALAAAFAQWGDSNAIWVPITTDPLGAWINAGNIGTWIAADGTHLSDPVGVTGVGSLMVQRVVPRLP